MFLYDPQKDKKKYPQNVIDLRDFKQERNTIGFLLPGSCNSYWLSIGEPSLCVA